MWSGVPATALALLALSVTVACRALAMRWSTPRGMHTGALIVWLLFALVLSSRAPGAGYLFTWPLLFSAGAALLSRGRVVAEWLAAAVTLFILAGFTYGVSVVLLGISIPGAVVLCVMTSFIALLLAPTIAEITDGARWWSAAGLALASGACFAIASLTVHPSADHPVRSALVYAENADSSDAWLGAPEGANDAWTRSAIGTDSVHSPAWTARLLGYAVRISARRVPRVSLAAPDAILVADSLMNGLRRVVLRVSAPAGTTGLIMRASGARVLTASIDGRVIDTTRYRSAGRRSHDASEWVMQYWAVPDSGATVALAIPAQGHVTFELAARRPGIPTIPGVTIPTRPPDVVPSQTGDVSIVYRERRF